MSGIQVSYGQVANPAAYGDFFRFESFSFHWEVYFLGDV